MSTFRLLDDASAGDLRTYLARARRADPDGDVRLQAVGPVLAAWTCVVPGRGISSSGLVLGLRTFALDEHLTHDVTVPVKAVSDRLARGGREIPEPPVTSDPTWRALSPPRSGWERVGALSADELRQVALDGIAEVARGAPEGSGSAAVADLRSRIWGRPTDTVPPVPAGGGYGLHVLGFLGGGTTEQVQVHTVGPWTRLSTPRGFVVCR